MVVYKYKLTAFALSSFCIFCKAWFVSADVIGVRTGTGKVAIRSEAFLLVIMARCLEVKVLMLR